MFACFFLDEVVIGSKLEDSRISGESLYRSNIVCIYIYSLVYVLIVFRNVYVWMYNENFKKF